VRVKARDRVRVVRMPPTMAAPQTGPEQPPVATDTKS
jgi:hypothetical protein